MKEFFDRLTNVLYVIGIILTCNFFYQGYVVKNDVIFPTILTDVVPSLVWIISLIPITLTWLLRYIFTGNKKIFPTFK